MTDNPNAPLSSAEVAALLGVSVSTVTRLYNRGAFPNARKGAGRTSALMIPRSDVEAYRKAQTKKARQF
jgi:excisionase family DNA binding protein